MQGFHKYVTREKLDNGIRKAVEAGYISPDEVDLVKTYVYSRATARGLSLTREVKITYILVHWKRFIKKPYHEMSLLNVLEGISALKSGKSLNDKPFKQNTLHDYIQILKPFLSWLVEEEHNKKLAAEKNIYKKIKEIRSPPVDYDTTDPNELFTIEDIQAMIKGCLWSRDRAIIAVLYESGCRCGELADLKWGNLTFDDYGAKLWVNSSKTKHLGKVTKRFNRLVVAADYLHIWKRDYPGDSEDPNAPLFVSEYGQPLMYWALKKAVQRAADRAKIRKSVTKLQTFRKSRCTNMINEGYQESLIKDGLWGNPETAMFRTYLKRSEKDKDQAYLSHHGLTQEEKTSKGFTVVKCPRCTTLNASGEDFCQKCSYVLTKAGEEKIEDFGQFVKSNPDLLVKFILDRFGK